MDCLERIVMENKISLARTISICCTLKMDLVEQIDDIMKLERFDYIVIEASQSATIHIGITPSTVLMMSEYIERFSKQYPGIHFDIHEGSTFNLKEQLEKHMIDITTLRTPITLNGCKTKRLIREKLAAVAADGYEGIEGFRKKDGSQISLREL